MVRKHIRAVTAGAVLVLLSFGALGYGAAPEAMGQPYRSDRGDQAAVTVAAGLSAASPQEQPQGPYRLGWGDRIRISVLGYEGISGDADVLPDGTITLPMAGRVQVNGATLAEVEQLITERLSARMTRPEVYVSVVRARPALVYVLGDGVAACVAGMGYAGGAEGTEAGVGVAGEAGASAGGPVEVGLLQHWRVSHLLSAVGGLRTRPELVHAFLRRETGETIPLDMVRIVTAGAMEADPLLLPGDMLFVNRIDTVGVYVAGQVLTPGSRPIVLGRTGGEVIGAAGGALPAADLHHVLIVRQDRSEVKVDLYDAIVNNDPTKDFLLQRGDVVIVPAR